MPEKTAVVRVIHGGELEIRSSRLKRKKFAWKSEIRKGNIERPTPNIERPMGSKKRRAKRLEKRGYRVVVAGLNIRVASYVALGSGRDSRAGDGDLAIANFFTKSIAASRRKSEPDWRLHASRVRSPDEIPLPGFA
jgi:hypothetical protein